MADMADLIWRRSMRCDTGTCVEIANDDDHVYLRDSTDPGGTVLIFTHDEWRVFLAGLKQSPGTDT